MFRLDQMPGGAGGSFARPFVIELSPVDQDRQSTWPRTPLLAVSERPPSAASGVRARAFAIHHLLAIGRESRFAKRYHCLLLTQHSYVGQLRWEGKGPFVIHW